MTDQLRASWTQQQQQIAEQVCVTDNNSWHQYFSSSPHADVSQLSPLFFAGVDVSFPTPAQDLTHAVATIAVVKIPTDTANQNSDLVLSQSKSVDIDMPYVSGFLAFREAPVVTQLLQTIPDVVRENLACLLLDGNGILHPRKAGLACHVGVQHDIPTIGVSKSLLCVDDLDEHQVREFVANHPQRYEGVDIVGKSGFTWAKALITGNATNKPIYVSVGHKVSLDTAAHVARTLSTFRVPDPIRYADLHSRAFLRGQPINVFNQRLFPVKEDSA